MHCLVFGCSKLFSILTAVDSLYFDCSALFSIWTAVQCLVFGLQCSALFSIWFAVHCLDQGWQRYLIDLDCSALFIFGVEGQNSFFTALHCLL